MKKFLGAKIDLDWYVWVYDLEKKEEYPLDTEGQGISWGYHGTGPTHLSYLLLKNVLPETPECEKLAFEARIFFREAYVSQFLDVWMLTEEEIQGWISSYIRRERII